MSDAYGTITAGFSKNFNGDLNDICEALNEFELNSDGIKFIVHENEIWLNT